MKFLLILLPLAALFIQAARPASTCTLSENYHVTINGTSNMHDWEETVEKVTGKGQVSWNSDGTLNVNAIDLNMQVRSIKSKNKTMNKNTYEALKADAHPQIIFHLTGPLQSIKVKGAAQTFAAKGNITVAGVTKPITMQVKVYMPSNNVLEVEGSQALKMSDFGVTAPVAMMGMMKTGDAITILYKTSFNISN